MSSERWNSDMVNVNRLHGTPYVSRPEWVPCQRCHSGKANISSLFEHCKAQRNEGALGRSLQQRPDNMGQNSINNNPVSRHLSPSEVLQPAQPVQPVQQTQQWSQPRERYLAALVNPQNPNLLQERNPLYVASKSLYPVPTQYQNSVPGRAFSARTTQAVFNQPSQASSVRVLDTKGFDESADKRTVWYLGQLEKPSPDIIFLESDDETEEHKLDLKL